MRLSFVLLLSLSTLFFGCYHAPLSRIPQYGYPEKTFDEIKADSSYQRDLIEIKNAESTQNDANYYIEEGFAEFEDYPYGYNAVYEFNKAWLLDSLNPHIYMGFALSEMEHGRIKSAIKHYAKYRELYEKNPVPRPRKTKIPYSESREKINSNKSNILIYGELWSLEKDNGSGCWEVCIADVAIDADNEQIHRYLENSNLLPENERYALSLALSINQTPLYTKGKIKVIKFYDEQDGAWKSAPWDSVFEFSFVERQGLFFSEEQKRLIELGPASNLDSLTRVFLLKPDTILSKGAVGISDIRKLESYSEYIPQNKWQDVSPNELKLKPYQEKKSIPPLSEIPVRSSIILALDEGKYDSLRTFLNAALKVGTYYGFMPISDYEFSLLNLLDKKTVADESIISRIQDLTMKNAKSTRNINDSLGLLIAYRSYPYVFSDEFNKKINALPNSSLLRNFAQKPYQNDSGF